MNTTIRLSFVAVIAVVAVIACDSVPLTSPTGSTITLSMDRTILPLGGQATVIAVVTESAGTPVHNGTVVTFQPSIGSVNPPEARTVNGVARATFLAGSASGTGVVHAFSGPARTGSGNTSGGGVTVKVGTAAAFGAIAVSASPSSVSQSGGTVTVSATVFDEATNPLPGVNVQFTSSSGTLSQTTATTDSNGIARTQLTTTQTATVTAIAGAAKGEARVEVSSAPTVTIGEPSPASPVAGAPVAFNVSASAGTGNSSPRQVQTLTVEFGDGESETRSNITGSSAFIHTYRNPGGYTVTARAVDVSGNSGQASRALIVSRSTPVVTVTPSDTTPASGQPIGFTVEAEPGVAGGPPIESWVAFVDGVQVASGSGNKGSFTHTFTSAGTKLVVVEARDSAGTVGRSQQFLTVS
jgi:hypothetical protein